jgi:hypothetical protein
VGAETSGGVLKGVAHAVDHGGENQQAEGPDEDSPCGVRWGHERLL